MVDNATLIIGLKDGGAAAGAVTTTGVAGKTALDVNLQGTSTITGAVTIANGADVCEGNTADAANVTGTTGTVSGKLRGLVQLLAACVDLINSRMNVFIQNTAIAVTQSGAWVLSAGAAIIGKVGIDQTTPGTTNKVSIGTDGVVAATQSGTWILGAGSAVIGKISLNPSATGGWSKSKKSLTNTVASVNSSAASAFGGYFFYNPNATEIYIQVFDVATAGAVTLGTTVADLVFGLPAGGAANIEIANGVAFANGIQVAATTTDTGSSAPASNVRCNFWFK